MKSRPVIVTTTNNISTPAKRTFFRIALTVAVVGTIALSTILIVQGGLALGRLRNFTDIGVHRLDITSILLLILGFLSLITFIILTIGLAKVNKTFAVVAAVLLGICSLALIGLSIWSFLTTTKDRLEASVNSTLIHELDKTNFTDGVGNNLIINNTPKMAKIEKQYRCCGLNNPLEDYRPRPSSESGSLSPSSTPSSGGRRTTSTHRNTGRSGSNVQLPVSCCNAKYLSADNLCVDIFENGTSPINRYNTNGCYDPVRLYKAERIKKQGLTSIVAACLAVISCISLAAVVRLLGEGYQIVPLRTPM